MTTENISHLWEAWSNTHSPDIANRLVEHYQYLVDFHAQRIGAHLPKNVQREDIRSLGFFGLFDALKKFEPERDLKFDTYASFRIRGTIMDGLRKEDWLPRSTREKTKKIEQAIQMLTQDLQREPTAEEIGQCVDMSRHDVEEILKDHLFSNILSIEEKSGENSEDFREGIGHSIIDNQQLTPEESIVKGEHYEELAQAIQHLNKNEQFVVSLFYYDELTFTEIGHVLNLTTSRISQIHKQAIFKLRHVLQQL